MKLGSSRGMDTKRPRRSERSKPCHELSLTRPSQPPYPWPPEQAQSGVSKPYRTTPAAGHRNLEIPRFLGTAAPNVRSIDANDEFSPRIIRQFQFGLRPLGRRRRIEPVPLPRLFIKALAELHRAVAQRHERFGGRDRKKLRQDVRRLSVWHEATHSSRQFHQLGRRLIRANIAQNGRSDAKMRNAASAIHNAGIVNFDTAEDRPDLARVAIFDAPERPAVGAISAHQDIGLALLPDHKRLQPSHDRLAVDDR